MRVALALALALAIATVAVAAPAGAEAPEPRAAPRLLIGELAEDGVERCLAGDKSEWLNLHPAVGFTPLLLTPKLDPEPLYGALVVATGAVEPAGLPPAPPVVHEAECVQAQMRSDWRVGPRGMRMLRRGMGELAPAFRASKIKPWRGLSMTVQRDNLVVVLTNTTPEELVAPVIRVHYEGCYGKPMATERELRRESLAAGARMVFKAPLRVHEADRPDGRTDFAAFSVQIATQPTGVAFDLDRTLASEGLSAQCASHKDAKE